MPAGPLQRGQGRRHQPEAVARLGDRPLRHPGQRYLPRPDQAEHVLGSLESDPKMKAIYDASTPIRHIGMPRFDRDGYSFDSGSRTAGLLRDWPRPCGRARFAP